MSVTVFWDDDKRNVIHQVFEGVWTIDEQRQSLYQIQKMVESQPHMVHTIMDMRATDHVPSKLMVNSRVAESTLQPNSGLILMVGAPSLVVSITAASARFMPRVMSSLSMVDTIEEAYDIIAAYEIRQP